MLINYLKTTLRLMWRERSYAAIHLLGLALGLGTCLAIGQYVHNELAFDRFHEHSARLVRVLRTEPGRTPSTNQTSTLGPTLASELPGVEAAVRFDGSRRDMLVTVGNLSDYENGLVYADANVFEEFSFVLELGDPQTALLKPYTIVLTPALARKYFGDADPIGQSIRLAGRLDMTVTGIVAAPPATSSIRFDMIGSFATQAETMWMVKNNPWNMQSFQTFLRLAPDVDREAMAASISGVVATHTDAKAMAEAIYELEPLTSMYLHSRGGDGGLGVSGDARYVYLFATTAGLVLLLACVNYTNLATARAVRRTQEVGVRRAIGADARSLRLQFLGESVVLSLVSAVLGAVVAEIAVVGLDRLGGISLPGLAWSSPVLLASYGATALFAGVASGLYPAVVLARSRISVMARNRGTAAGSKTVRHGLVVGQFAIATALLVGLFVIQEQMAYVQDKRLGLEPAQVLAVSNHAALSLEQSRAFRQELTRHAAIATASAVDALPSRGNSARTVQLAGSDEEHWIAEFHGDEDLARALGIELVEGRWLTQEDEVGDARHIVINETAVANFGWERPLGQSIIYNGESWKVVGVMADFHFESLRSKVWPLMIGPSQRWGFGHLVVRMQSGDIAAGLAHIEDTWRAFAPDRPLQTTWLDASFARLYERERQVSALFTLFCGVAFIIACVGLYGLAAYAAEARTTEIGVRKVFGATVSGLTTRMTSDFLLLVVIGLALGAPAAWWMSEQWLQEFAYRVEPGAGIFASAAGVVLLLATLTVSQQSIRAALADPVRTLRHQ